MTFTGPNIPQQALLEQLLEEAVESSSPRRSAMMYHELGRIHEVFMGQLDQAQEYYHRGFARDPSLAVNTRALGRLLAREGKRAALLPVLEAELTAAGDDEERAAILVERAEILADDLSDLAAAYEDLIRALELAPADGAAMTALVQICQRSGRHEDLEGLLRRQAEACDDVAQASRALLQAADIRQQHLDDAEGAAALYRAALEADPANRHAAESLAAHARITGDHTTAAELCLSLAQLTPGAEACHLRWEAARVYRDQLDAPDRAVDCLQDALEECPEEHRRPLMIDLALLLLRQAQWQEAANVLARLVSDAGPGAEAAALAHLLARVRLRGDDGAGAIEALRRALALDPRHEPSRRALERLYRRQGRHGDVADLLWDDLARLSDPDEVARAAMEAGQVMESATRDLPGASRAYELALEARPNLAPALRCLAQIKRSLGLHDEEAAALQAQLAAADEEEEQVALLERLAALLERELADPAGAVDALLRLLVMEPGHHMARRTLIRLLRDQERFEELAAVLKTALPLLQESDHTRPLMELARIQQRHLGDEEAALGTYTRILKDRPDYQPALAEAGRILLRVGRQDELVNMHRQELQHTSIRAHADDPAHQAWLMMKMARIMGDGLGCWEEAATACSGALGLGVTGDEAPGLDELLHILLRSGNMARALEVMRAMPPPRPPQARALFHRRLAELHGHAGDQESRIKHLRLALQASPEDDAPAHELAHIHRRARDHQTLLNLLQSRAARSVAAGELHGLRVQKALLWATVLRDPRRSVEELDKILDERPGDVTALHLLQFQLARQRTWRPLAEVLQRIHRLMSEDQADDGGYGAACALAAAGLLEHRLDDLKTASHAAFLVLAAHPQHREALDILDYHYRETGDPEGLLSVQGRLLTEAQSTMEQTALLCTMGSVLANRGDLAAALEQFRQAAQGRATYLPAVRCWVRAAEALDMREELAQALAAEASASRDLLHRARCTYRAGQIWHNELGEQERAVTAYKQVLRMDPNHGEAIRELSSLHSVRGEWAEKVALLERSLADAASPEEALGILNRVANIQRSRQGDTAGALATIKRALELAPDDRPLLTALAELSRTEGDVDGLLEADRRLVEQTSDPVLLKALHFELGRILEEQRADAQGAIAEFSRVLAMDPNDLSALTHLADLHAQQEDWHAAVHAVDSLIALDDDHHRQKEYHLRLALLHRDGLDEPSRAMEACAQALRLDPGFFEATEVMTRLLREHRPPRALATHLESSVAVHRARLQRDPFLEGSYQALLRCFGWQDNPDGTRVVVHLLDAIGVGGSRSLRHAAEWQARGSTPAHPLTSDEVEVLLSGDERGPLHTLLRICEPAARDLLPSPEPEHDGLEAMTTEAHPELSACVDHLMPALGEVDMVATISTAAPDRAWVQDGPSPLLCVGRDLAKRPPAELAFVLGRCLAHVLLGHHSYATLPPRDLGRFVAAVLSVSCRSFIPPGDMNDLEPLCRDLQRLLPGPTLRALAPAALELSDRPLAPKRWRVAMTLSEDRLGLLLCGSPGAALRCLLREEGVLCGEERATAEHIAREASPRVRQLLGFCVSEDHLRLRRQLGLSR